MRIIQDGITSNSTDLTEYKRHSISMQQQMQSQLTDLREKLTSAFGEITSLVKQKAATDQELMSEINALQHQLALKTAELEALKKIIAKRIKSCRIALSKYRAPSRLQIQRSRQRK